MKTLKHVEYTLPVYWASYLINGDDSSISPLDKAACDAFHAKHHLPSPVSCDDEPRFSWRNDATNLGGEVCDFTYFIN